MQKILVIEDEQTIRENIVDILESRDYIVHSAPNGKIGIELAKEYKPDLIISDIMMPEVDGYGVLSTLRSYEPTSHIPFIFLSAKADKSDIRSGMDLGADDYLSKPFKMNELLTAISTRLIKHKSTIERAERASQELRADLSKSIPHEFITPLNSILGFTEVLIAMNADNEDQLEMLRNIQIGAKRLQRLVENFILYSKLSIAINDPEKVAQYRAERLKDSVYVITETIGDIIGRYGQPYSINCNAEDAGPTIVMNTEYLQKLLIEVLDNAHKFSKPNSHISIEIQIREQDIKIRVTNEGRGFTEEQIARIGAYMQFDRVTYEQQGVGLGLALVQSIMHLFGGSFSVESVPNVSATVQLIIPIARS